MPAVDERTLPDVIDSILKQNQQMKLAGMLQGAGISLTIGKPGEGATATSTSSSASRPTRPC